MGNSQKKPEGAFDLSPSMLTQTSVEDKIWLNVPEENLFNDTFTNEKYYMLNTNSDVEETSSTNDQQFNEVAESKLKLDDMLYFGMVDEQRVEQAIVSSLVEQLATSSVRSEYFETILKKRLYIIKRIYLALNRERARDQIGDVRIYPDTAFAASKHSVPSIVRMTVRMFVALLREQISSARDVRLIDTLNELLHELPLLSLKDEPEDCLDAFRSWLLSRFESGTDVQVKSKALESLIGLALAQGSLRRILNVIAALLNKESGDQNKEAAQFPLHITPVLQKLCDWRIELPLSPLKRENLCGTWSISWSEIMTVARSDFESPPSLATDGAYLYLHDGSGLVKVGTGLQGTLQGRIYARRADWPADRGSMAVIGTSLLVWRSYVTAPSSIKLVTLGLEDLPSPALHSGLLVKPESPSSRTPVISDGRMIYVIGLLGGGRQGSYCVDIYDPLVDWRHVNRIELRYTDSEFSSFSAPVLSAQCADKASFYTNGQYLMVVVPPPLATEYNFDNQTYICRCFNLRDGTLVGNFPIDTPIGPAVCYDHVNNVIWSYSSSELEVAWYVNEGIAPKHHFPKLRRSRRSNDDQVALPTEGRDLPPLEIAQLILQVLSRFSVESMPNSSEGKHRESNLFNNFSKTNATSSRHSSLREPFCVEVHGQTYELLYQILQQSSLQAQNEAVPDITRPLQITLYCLRILKVNIHRLAANQIHPRDINLEPPPLSLFDEDSGITSPKPREYNLLMSIRELLLYFISEAPLDKQLSGTESSARLMLKIQSEACDVLTVGLEVFYPSHTEQARFILKLLTQSTSVVHNELGIGSKMLLHSLFDVLVNHRSPSYLVLPPSDDEMDAAGMEKIPDESKIDPLHLFVPLITRLVKEAHELNSSGLSPVLPLLQAIQKDLLLRAEKYASASDIPARALITYVQLITTQFKELFDRLIGSALTALTPDHLTEIQWSVVGSLMPTLMHTLFLFSNNCWLAQQIMPQLLDLIQAVDQINRLMAIDFDHSSKRADSNPKLQHRKTAHLSMGPGSINLPAPLTRNNSNRDSLTFNSGEFNAPHSASFNNLNATNPAPHQVVESQHPYAPGVDTKVIVRVPGAVFLSLVFDERCYSQQSRDYLQICIPQLNVPGTGFNADPADSQYYLVGLEPTSKAPSFVPIGDRYSGDRTRWPKRRVLVPGDTVMLHFHSESGLSTAVPRDEAINTRWGYRCIVMGNMSDSRKITMPWSIHLEKTLCSLVGHLAASLISGEALIEEEKTYDKLLSEDIFQGGLSEDVVDKLLTPVNSAPVNLNTMPLSADPERDFCLEVKEGRGLGMLFAQWIADKSGQNIIKINNLIPIERAILAALLRHLTIARTAYEFSVARSTLVVPGLQLQQSMSTQLPVPSAALLDLISTMRTARETLLRRMQAVAEVEDSVRSKEEMWRELTLSVSAKAELLIHLRAVPSTSKQRRVLSKTLLEVLLGPVTVQDIRRVLLLRRSRANSRAMGLQAIRALLARATYNTMKIEALCFLGPSLRNSGQVKNSWPHHYANHLAGCGARLFSSVNTAFTELMSELSVLLRDNNNDFNLQLLALDSWALSFKPADYLFMNSVRIFPILYRLIMRSWMGPQQESEEDKRARRRLHFNAKIIFKLMVVNTITTPDEIDHPHHKGILGLKESFFKLVAAHLDDFATSWGTTNSTDDALISPRSTPASAGTTNSAPSESGPSLQQLELVRLLYLLAIIDAKRREASVGESDENESANNSTESVTTRLLKPPFTQVWTRYLTSGHFDAQKLVLRLLSTALPLTALAPDCVVPVLVPPLPAQPLVSLSQVPAVVVTSPSTAVSVTTSNPLSVSMPVPPPSSTSSGGTLPLSKSSSTLGPTPLTPPTQTPISSAPSTPRGSIDGNESSPSQTEPQPLNASPSSSGSATSLIPTPVVTPLPLTAPSSPVQNDDTQWPLRIVTLLFEILGTVQAWACNDIERGIQATSATMRQLLQSLLTSSSPTLQLGSIRNVFTLLTPRGDARPGRLSLSHPFFPLYSSALVALPSGWARDSQNKHPSVRLSSFNRTATVVGPIENSAHAVLLKADSTIPESVSLFYFEVRIDDVGSDDHGMIAIGLWPSDSSLPALGLPGTNAGFGYYSEHGHKLSSRYGSHEDSAATSGEHYGASYGAGDIVGCGWVKNTNTIFFTKNGVFQGIAFKNVYGSYYPAVGLSAQGASIAVNFGQMPFRYDLTPVIKKVKKRMKQEEIERIGHESMALASEVTALLRRLLLTAHWRPVVLQMISHALGHLPQFLSSFNITPPALNATPPLTPEFENSVLISCFASISVLGTYHVLDFPIRQRANTRTGGDTDDLRVGGKVRVELEGNNATDVGVLVDFKPNKSWASVLLESSKQFSKGRSKPVQPTVHNISSLRPLPSVPVDPSWFEIAPKIFPSLVIFLQDRSTNSPFFKVKKLLIYQRFKSRALKVLHIMFQNDRAIKHLLHQVPDLLTPLIDHALTQISKDEQPHLLKIERLSIMLMKRLFEAQAPQFLKKLNINLPANTPPDEELNERRTSEVGTGVIDVLESEDDISEESPHVIGAMVGAALDELEEDGTVTARPIRWHELSVGSAVMVSGPARRGRGQWQGGAMDRTVGLVGVIKALDPQPREVLLRLVDSRTGCVEEWWYSVNELRHVPVPHSESRDRPRGDSVSERRERSNSDPMLDSYYSQTYTHCLMQFDELLQGPIYELRALALLVESDLAILYSRYALMNLMASLPHANKLNISSLGGPKKMIGLLKLAYALDLSSARRQTPELYRWTIGPELHLLENKLTSLIKKEAVSHLLQSVSTDKTKKPKKESPQVAKSGYMNKQGKMFKQWKKYWFTLNNGYLYYYKSPQATTPVGAVDLAEIVSVEGTVEVKKKKDKDKDRDDYSFTLVTVHKTLVLQTSSSEERADWASLIKRYSTAQNKVIKPLSKSAGVDSVFVTECVAHLRESINQEHTAPITVEHWYPYELVHTKLRKMIYVLGAESLLVTFDTHSSLKPGLNVLRFYRNVGCTDLINSYTGKGACCFPPTVIDSNRFWFTLDINDEGDLGQETGVKFHVTPLRQHLSDTQLLNKPSFDIGFLLVDWFLTIDPFWIKQFYSKDVFNLLVQHLEGKCTFERRLKIITVLRKLLQRWDDFPKDSKPNLNKLEPLKSELFELHDLEKKIGGEHSLYCQRLFELIIQMHKLTTPNDAWIDLTTAITTAEIEVVDKDPRSKKPRRNSASETEKETRAPPPPRRKDRSKRMSSEEPDESLENSERSQTSSTASESGEKKREKEDKKKATRTESFEHTSAVQSASKDNSKRKKRKKKKIKVDISWFYSAVNTVLCIERLSKGEDFPAEMCKEAISEANKQIIVEQSPHPYPRGVRVTNTVVIPNARQLIVSFDPRSRTEVNCDYLMFSKHVIGGDDLGFFTGQFPSEELIFPGDSFIWSFLSDAAVEVTHWGFRFTVTPVFGEEKKPVTAGQTLTTQQLSMVDDLDASSTEWTLLMDAELVQFVNSQCERHKVRTDELPLTEIFAEFAVQTNLQRKNYPSIASLSTNQLARRVQLLRHFNHKLRGLVPLLDFSHVTLHPRNDLDPTGDSDFDKGSFALLTLSLKPLIFHDTKLDLLNEHLIATQSNLKRPTIALDRQLANTDRLDNCVYLQLFKALRGVDPARLRQNDRAWEVRFENEGADDAGGPYRESITLTCADLVPAPGTDNTANNNSDSSIKRPPFNLFIRCPNYYSGVGDNQDKFIPNPAAHSLKELQMFEFLGRLMGIALRTKNAVIDLDFPSLIWKSLLGIKPDRSDLEMIDKSLCQYLETIQGYSSKGLTSGNFRDYIFETFTVKTSDGRVVELKPGGKNIAVEWKNRKEFTALVEQYRLKEFKQQIDAIQRGLRSIVPTHMLALFTWKELELKICGRPGVDLELLKKHTRYTGGVQATDRYVTDFWRVLESMNEEERGLLLRFVWGRSRLPHATEFKNIFFTIQPFMKTAQSRTTDTRAASPRDATVSPRANSTSESDNYLPEAQTCFFSLSLPPYSSYDVMRAKLLYAITTCREIDTDFSINERTMRHRATNNVNSATEESGQTEEGPFSDDEGLNDDAPASCETQ